MLASAENSSSELSILESRARARRFVLGLGNRIAGDDALGPTVVDALLARGAERIAGVHVEHVAAPGPELVELLERPVEVWFVDAARDPGCAPGTVIEREIPGRAGDGPDGPDGHDGPHGPNERARDAQGAISGHVHDVHPVHSVHSVHDVHGPLHDALHCAEHLVSSHGFSLAELLLLAERLGRRRARVRLFGVVAERFDPCMPLSPPVADAADRLVERLLGLLSEPRRS